MYIYVVRSTTDNTGIRRRHWKGGGRGRGYSVHDQDSALLCSNPEQGVLSGNVRSITSIGRSHEWRGKIVLGEYGRSFDSNTPPVNADYAPLLPGGDAFLLEWVLARI